MENARWIALSLAAVAVAVIIGCGGGNNVIGKSDTDNGDKIIEQEPQQPEWVNALGRWEEEWKKDHPEEARRYIWVVATSLPVDSLDREQWAEKSAQEQAIEELIHTLGITVNSLGMETEAWSDETRDLVIGSYKEAVKTQMANHKVNFKIYEWYRYVVETTGIGGTRKRSYIKKGLFRLDKALFDEKFVDDTIDEFAKNMSERIKKNTEVQKELVNRAKEQTRKAMQDLLGK